MIRIRDENINTPAFWDLVWEEEPEGTGLTTDRWIALTSDLNPTATILDVGGGRGEFLYWTGERIPGSSHQRTLLDQSRYAVAVAILHGRTEIGAVGDCLDLPFADDTYDATFCNEVIEHVEDPKLLLDELHRVTRPGGLVGITTPLSNSTDDKQHVWSISPEDISALFWTEPRIAIGSGPTIVATATA